MDVMRQKLYKRRGISGTKNHVPYWMGGVQIAKSEISHKVKQSVIWKDSRGCFVLKLYFWHHVKCHSFAAQV